MKIEDLPNWAAFEERVQQLFKLRAKFLSAAPGYVSSLLFRGQADASWNLATTLERTAPAFLRARDYYKATHNAKHEIESLTERRWDILTPPEYADWLKSQSSFGATEFPADEFLIHLRHHGFPSPLLDWSRSPYIAAFFAFRTKMTNVDRVAVYAYLEHIGVGKLWETDAPKISVRGPTVRAHRRHVMQQCEYTICTATRLDEDSRKEWYYACHENIFDAPENAQDILWKLTIPVTERLKVLRSLDRYNLNAFSLFGSEESLMETAGLRVFSYPEQWFGTSAPSVE